MTSTLSRRTPRGEASAPPSGPPRPVALSAVLAALGAAAAGTVLVVAVAVAGWIAGASGSIADALRTGATAWLVGHGSGVELGGVRVGAVPLGLTLLFVCVVSWVARVAVVPSRVRSVRGLLELATVGAVAYAAWAVVLVVAAQNGAAQVDLVRAAGGALAVAFVGLVWGGLRGSDAREWLGDEVPASVRAGARAATTAVAAVLVAGLVTFVVALVRGLDTFARLWGSLAPGPVGGVLLALVCLAVVPNLGLWSVAVLLGPGFALGADTAVTLDGSRLGAVPALPVLAALPTPAGFPAWVVGLCAVPALAGAIGGWRASRRLEHGPWTYAALVGLAGGAAGGLVITLLLAVSGGSVGPGRMADTGPDLLPCAALAVLTLAVGGGVGAVAGHYRGAGAQDPPARD